MECLDGGLPPRGSAPPSKVSEATSQTALLESPWWSCAGPITARSQVISTAPSGCTRAEERSGAGNQSVEGEEKLCC